MIYGVTVGPIVETLSRGKKTAEIWAASYIFSYLMKNIAKSLYEKKAKFIIPYVEGNFEEKDGGIGMYHDRLVFEWDMSIDEVEKIIEKEKENLGGLIAKAIKEDEQKVKEYIKKYIKTYIAAKEKSDSPIIEMYEILDNLEYNEEVYDYEDYIDRFLIRENIINSSLVKKTGKKGFHSIPEIASAASGKNYGYMEDDSDYYKKLNNELGEDFKQVYKYIAIVHADGDNLGKVVKNLKLDGEKKYENEVSKALFNFGEKSKEVLDKYGCDTIFIGGDDLLFFSPVIMKVNDKNKTIFDLLDGLKDIYEKEFEFYNKNVSKDNKTTLSFGISINYYKFPLNEALNLSRNALFGKAKEIKNAVNITMRKHSGQTFDLRVRFDDERYKVFKNLLKDVLFDKSDIPFSVHYKLNEIKELINLIDSYDAFFENYFNEDIHKEKFKKGLEEIKKLIELTDMKEKKRIEKLHKEKKDGKKVSEELRPDKLKFVFPAVSVIKLLKGRK